MQLSGQNLTANSWFHTGSAAKIFAEFQDRDLEWVQLDPALEPLPMLVYEYQNSRNLIPSYGYAGVNIAGGPIATFDPMAAVFSALDVTAAFLGIQEPGEGGDYRQQQEGYVARMPSYELDLSISETDLRSNVSRRRRSKLMPRSQDLIEFCINDKDRLIAPFLRFYAEAMARLGADDRFVFDPGTLTALCRLPSTDMIGVLLDGSIELVMLHGRAGTRAEFVFSGTSDAGRGLATIALWHSALWYKDQGITHFHLGGGMTPGDGLDNFKRQLGGAPRANGGVKMVLDPERYAALCAALPEAVRGSGFFPPYLRAAVLGKN